MIGYSNEKKGYQILSNGKFIVSKDVIFDENEGKSAEEVESILQKLETKTDKRNGNLQSQPHSPSWYELEFPSSDDDSSSLSSSPAPSNSSSSSSNSPSSSGSSDNDSPPPEPAFAQQKSVYINPLFNDGDFSQAQTSEHELPKWVVQLLKDVRPNEKNKTRTRGSKQNEGNFALIANDFTEPSSYQEAAKHKAWQQAMVDEY